MWINTRRLFRTIEHFYSQIVHFLDPTSLMFNTDFDCLWKIDTFILKLPIPKIQLWVFKRKVNWIWERFLAEFFNELIQRFALGLCLGIRVLVICRFWENDNQAWSLQKPSSFFKLFYKIKWIFSMSYNNLRIFLCPLLKMNSWLGINVCGLWSEFFWHSTLILIDKFWLEHSVRFKF